MKDQAWKCCGTWTGPGCKCPCHLAMRYWPEWFLKQWRSALREESKP
jgi:hypothetical protein